LAGCRLTGMFCSSMEACSGGCSSSRLLRNMYTYCNPWLHACLYASACDGGGGQGHTVSRKHQGLIHTHTVRQAKLGTQSACRWSSSRQ
jgi:hypothetical protein